MIASVDNPALVPNGSFSPERISPDDNSVSARCCLPLPQCMASARIHRIRKTVVLGAGSKGKSPPPTLKSPPTDAQTPNGYCVESKKETSSEEEEEDSHEFVVAKPKLIFKIKSQDSGDLSASQSDSESQDETEENEDGLTASFTLPLVHHTVKDYEKICTLGTGTFGRVMLVKHKSSEDYYALKVLRIHDVVHLKQVQHVHSEKSLLAKLNHPFVIKMHWAYHDCKALYMLLDFVPGGEMFSYLRSARKFSNRVSLFYAAEIVSVLEYLHKQSIVYRDLKPENLLLDTEGHLRITDFGFAKELNDRTWTLCGTPEYLSPEVIEGKGHNRAVDWWALGVLIYEMQAGYPPFRGDNAIQIYEKIIDGVVKFPKTFDLVSKDLVRKLLVSDRTQRLGNMKNGADDVKKHKWFSSINWEDVRDKKLQPPIVPKIFYDGDTGNFDEYDEEELSDMSDAPDCEIDLFKDW